MTSSLATVSYIAATILFILSLGGLPTPKPRAAATSSASSA
jgi:NAD/NADP transhydrogenase beta subunit